MDVKSTSAYKPVGHKRGTRYPCQVTTNLSREDFELLNDLSARTDLARAIIAREACIRGINAVVKAVGKLSDARDFAGELTHVEKEF